jgi:tetratricopeptide (TPR) repeat protein
MHGKDAFRDTAAHAEVSKEHQEKEKEVSMIRRAKPIIFFLLLLSLMSLSPQMVQAQLPQELLNQYVSGLQKNPEDNALREKIIKLVQTMTPKPGIPEEARRNYVMAKTLFKDAKNVQDYDDALVKFKTALLLAPWWADAYLDTGLAFETAQKYNDAINALRLFIAASPDSEKARKAQDEIYIIEAKNEKAAKESSPEAINVKKQKTYEEWLTGLDGARYVGQSNLGSDLYWDNELVIRGTALIWRKRITSAAPDVVLEIPIGQWFHMARMQIIGRTAERFIPNTSFINDIFTISEDGNSITQAVQTTNGGTFTFYRQ